MSATKELLELLKKHDGFSEAGLIGPGQEHLFENANKCHDWRNHVPSWAIENWSRFTPDARLAVCLMAKELADREEWE